MRNACVTSWSAGLFIDASFFFYSGASFYENSLLRRAFFFLSFDKFFGLLLKNVHEHGCGAKFFGYMYGTVNFLFDGCGPAYKKLRWSVFYEYFSFGWLHESLECFYRSVVKSSG